MREYLFRGKMIANGKWSEGNLLVTKQSENNEKRDNS